MRLDAGAARGEPATGVKRVRVLGLDFSGSAAQWARRTTSNVWIAELRGDATRPRVVRLAPVQRLAYVGGLQTLAEGGAFARTIAGDGTGGPTTYVGGGSSRRGDARVGGGSSGRGDARVGGGSSGRGDARAIARPGGRTARAPRTARPLVGSERGAAAARLTARAFPAWEALVALLAAGDFDACGIDAPLALPRSVWRGARAELLGIVADLPCPGRPFPTGAALVAAVAGRPPPLSPAKPLRACERLWASRGVNVRSTLWDGSRGGAAFTAAALALAARCGLPAWPFEAPAGSRCAVRATASGSHRAVGAAAASPRAASRPRRAARAGAGCLVEAFPAGQLRAWGLPHVRYDGAAGARVRGELVRALAPRVELGSFQAAALASADALDAVLAALAATALIDGALHDEVPAGAGEEGWIAVRV